MKKFNKVLAVILALIMTAAALPVASLAADKSDWSDYPVVLVPGYSSSQLEKINDDGTTEQVWGVDFEAVGAKVLERIGEIGLGLGLAASGKDAKYIADVVASEADQFLDGIRCNADGTSVYNIRPIHRTAEKTNNAYYLAHPEDSAIAEGDIMGQIGELIGPENIFNFNVDFRMGAIYCAEKLNDYILDVLDYTGAEKVNIIAISHGGQVTGTYLSLHGTEGYVDNAVLIVPALGGAGIAYDAFNRDVKFDEDLLAKFLQHGFVSETDYNWLVRAQATGFLDDILYELIPHLYKYVLYWGSLWDFIPSEYYEELKGRLLDKEASAELIAASDRMHYEIMPNYNKNLTACREAGVNVNIIAGTDNPIITGLSQNSDAIITTTSSTGAYTAPFGKRFSDGYTGKNTTCSDPAHHHISPAMTVDGSTAYLPENTFYVEGLFHGMEHWDAYTSALLKKLLLTDEITDVYSDKNFTQFHATTNAESAVTAYFDKSEEGFVASKDKNLIVTNLSKQYSVTIVSIDCQGMDTVFFGEGKTIAPGQSIKIKIQGKVPEVSLKKVQLTVNYYTSVAALTPFGSRTLSFTVMNGKAVKYNSDKPFDDVNVVKSYFPDVTGDRAPSVLEKLGMLKFVEMFFDMFYTIYQNIVRLIKLA